MRNRLLVPIAALSLLVIAACSDSPTDSSTSTGDSYFPTSKGSTWTYTGNVDYTVTVTGDTTIAGRSYTTISNSGLPGKVGLIRKTDGIYYQADAGDLAGEQIFFKENVPANESWTFEYTAPNGFPNKADFTLVELGGTRTVAGKEYTNVAHLHSVNSMKHPLTGTWVVFTQADYYYAKGVGLIQSDLGVQGKSDLTSYSIK
jgi:hypothetical protein